MSSTSRAGSSYNSTPHPRHLESAKGQSSCFESHFESVKSSRVPEGDLLACLVEELQETRTREKNLKRINNILSRALNAGETKGDRGFKENACAGWSMESTMKIEPINRNCEELEQTSKPAVSQLNETQQPRPLSLKQSCRSVLSNSSARSHREQSVQNMKELVESIKLEREGAMGFRQNKENNKARTPQQNSSWVSSACSIPAFEGFVKRNSGGHCISDLVTHLIQQKIGVEMKLKFVEKELTRGDLSRRQREMLEKSAKSIRAYAKSDQYQEYLKEKIVKEIDRYSTRMVLAAKNTMG